MVKIRKNLVPASKYSIKCPYAMTPQWITIHNTYNDASAQNEIAYMVRNNNATSYHFAVDDKEAIQGLPLNRNGFHAGDGSTGNGNRKSIGIEICYSKSGGARYTKAEQNAVELTAQLLHERGWGVDRVKGHFQWSRKNCPHRILDEGRWKSFLNRISQELKRLKGGGSVGTASKPKPSKPSKPSSTTTGKTYKVIKSINGYLSATDAKARKNKKATVKPNTYHVYKESNGMINVSTQKDKAGSWINPADNKASSSSSSNTKPKANLKVDGHFGTDTTKALQRYLGTSVDGVISGQYKNNVTRNIPSVKYGTSGSLVVAKLQALLGVKTDGYFGVETLKALQKRMGTTVDGKLSKPSLVIMEMQRRLNKGKL